MEVPVHMHACTCPQHTHSHIFQCRVFCVFIANGSFHYYAWGLSFICLRSLHLVKFCALLVFSACAGSPAVGGQYPAISSAHREKPASHVWSWAPCKTSTKMQCCSVWWGPLAAPTAPEDVWKAGLPGAAADGVEVRRMALKSGWAQPCCLHCHWLAISGLEW